jgi:glycosyltransferase involved in cell wall biosynthesis
MNILIVHELFPPAFAGGGETLVYNMAKQLQNRGHQVTVLTSGDPSVKYHEDIRTIRLPRHRFLMNFAWRAIYTYAKHADIIQTATYNTAFPSWLAGKLLHKPTVCLVMSFWGDQWRYMRPGITGKISQFGERIQVNRRFDKKIFLSDFSQEFAFRSGISTDNAIVINPGLDVTPYKPLPKDIDVLFSGRFAKQKGVYDVLNVARRLPHITFVMMGWGEEEEQLRRQAPENVTFLNLSVKDRQRFYEMYGRAKVFFLPSYGETFGFVLVEAAAAGAAIVSTIPLGFKGRLHQCGDIEGMAQSIAYLIDNPKECQKMGEANVRLAHTFTWKKFTDQLEAVYKDVIKKYSRHSTNECSHVVQNHK